MSEDIDIGITREYLGFGGNLSKTQVNDKLRRAACSFVREKMQFDLKEQMIKDGIDASQFEIKIEITPVSTTDPEVIWVYYKSVAPVIEYIAPVVKIEVSGRSMSEPTAETEISSLIDAASPDASFCESNFIVRAVLPKRTFLEKLFLLHEEFAKGEGNIRIERMSRHLYDIHKMLNTPIAEEALSDEALYQNVIEHRRKFIGLRGFDYDTLGRSTLNIIPPMAVYADWKKDYEAMQDQMIYGDSAPFETMIEELQRFNQEINQL